MRFHITPVFAAARPSGPTGAGTPLMGG
jgi:hypothetical protein